MSLKAGSGLEATVSEAVPAHIFEPGDRTDTRPKRDIQGIWEHLNKRGSPGYDGVRALINDWYARIPQGKGKRDLFDKLVSKKSESWHAGFWELYLHESLSRAGYELEIEPDIAGSTRHPDFLVIGHGQEFYVEAAAVTEDITKAADRRTQHIYQYLDPHPHPNFWLGLDINDEGNSGPHLRRLLADVTKWFDGLDPDQTPYGSSIEWSDGDWNIDLIALPKSQASRGKIEPDRLIGMRSGGVGWSDMSDRIRQKVHSKATRYGELGKPYLIALTVNSALVEEDDLASALLGPEVVEYYEQQPGSARLVRKRDGLLMGPGGPRNTRVSGLLVAFNVACTHVGLVRPALWPNPWVRPEIAFTAPLPFDRVEIDPSTTAMAHATSDFDPLPYFELAPDWPGFEDPLIGRRRIT